MSESLRNRFVKGGQGHVFDFFGDLSVDQQQKLVASLESVDVERCNAIFKSATKPSNGSPVSISPLPGRVFESIVTATAEQKSTWNTAGLHAVSENKVNIIPYSIDRKGSCHYSSWWPRYTSWIVSAKRML